MCGSVSGFVSDSAFTSAGANPFASRYASILAVIASLFILSGSRLALHFVQKKSSSSQLRDGWAIQASKSSQHLVCCQTRQDSQQTICSSGPSSGFRPDLWQISHLILDEGRILKWSA